MNLTVKDIISFCIDRGLRQFHLNCKWALTKDVGAIPDSAKSKIKEKKEDFFAVFNYFVVIKSDGIDTAKISNLVSKSLTGSGPENGESFVQMAGDNVVVAGLKIEE